MRIKYNILWVENEQDWLESIVDEIQDFVEELGFKFSYEVASRKSDIHNYNKYDLILMDLNLASEPTGDEIIQDIRNMEIYTDVVFYSASGIDAIRSKGKEKELEGVYYSGRNKELFLNKVQGVIMTTIRKTQDLTNLRGLVMAEVSELDVMMGEILTKYLDIDENLTKFHSKVTTDREKAIHKSLEHPECKKDCVLAIRKNQPADVVAKIDAYQKARGINLILNDMSSEGKSLYKSTNGKGFMENYDADIIKVRNNLAHCKSVDDKENCQEILVTLKGDMVFTSDTFVTIRKNIMLYHDLFDAIMRNIMY